MKRRIYSLIAALCIVAVYAVYNWGPGPVEALEQRVLDWKFRCRGSVPSHPDVVLVEVDDTAVDVYGRWPWDRRTVAELIRGIDALGASTIALDIVFSEEAGPEEDAVLAGALREAGNVVASYFFRDEPNPREERDAARRLPKHSVGSIEVAEPFDELPLPFFRTAETNIDTIDRAAVSQGYHTVLLDRDGLLRDHYALAQFQDYLMPSLALAALEHYRGAPVSAVLDRYGIRRLSLGEESIPVDSHGRVPINFYGRKDTIPNYSAVEILRGGIEPGAFDGKLVFLGITETGLGDFHSTPSGRLPGSAVHCTFASNVLQQNYLLRDERTVMADILALVLIPVIVLVGTVYTRSTVHSLAVAVGAFAVFCAVNLSLFVWGDVVLSATYPVYSFVLSFVGLETYRNFVQTEHSRELKRAFESYVSPELVKQIQRDPDKLKLGGEARDVTVFFSDIRGFTQISETVQPEELVALLNDFLGPCTETILAHRGMLDKYIGDAIVALFNAPLDTPGHADLAVRAAVEISRKLKEINAANVKKGRAELSIGIGIHTGRAVVGNIGTRARFDYTAVGDTVNLGSRLEGLNKYYGTQILISETTYRSLENRCCARRADVVRVKGRREPVGIYQVSADGFPEGFPELYERAVDAYRRGERDLAGKLFRRCERMWPEDPLVAEYLRRIDRMEASPPEGWSYVKQHDSK